jgi:hypothetical protein
MKIPEMSMPNPTAIEALKLNLLLRFLSAVILNLLSVRVLPEPVWIKRVKPCKYLNLCLCRGSTGMGIAAAVYSKRLQQSGIYIFL